MGFKYSILDDGLYFLTHTVTDWVDVFTRRELAEVIVKSLNYCIANKSLEVFVWCLMPSHLHMIARTAEVSITISVEFHTRHSQGSHPRCADPAPEEPRSAWRYYPIRRLVCASPGPDGRARYAREELE